MVPQPHRDPVSPSSVPQGASKGGRPSSSPGQPGLAAHRPCSRLALALTSSQGASLPSEWTPLPGDTSTKQCWPFCKPGVSPGPEGHCKEPSPLIRTGRLGLHPAQAKLTSVAVKLANSFLWAPSRCSLQEPGRRVTSPGRRPGRCSCGLWPPGRQRLQGGGLCAGSHLPGPVAWGHWKGMAEQMSPGPPHAYRGLSQHPYPFLLTQSAHWARLNSGALLRWFSVASLGFCPSVMPFTCLLAIPLGQGLVLSISTSHHHPWGLAESSVQGCLWAAELEAQLLVPKPLVWGGRNPPLSSRGRDSKAKLLPAPDPWRLAWPGPSTSPARWTGLFPDHRPTSMQARAEVFTWRRSP